MQSDRGHHQNSPFLPINPKSEASTYPTTGTSENSCQSYGEHPTDTDAGDWGELDRLEGCFHAIANCLATVEVGQRGPVRQPTHRLLDF